MIRIYVWPDSEWCHEEEIAEYGHKSDDYLLTEIPDWNKQQMLAVIEFMESIL